jgi:hypothetical protein
MGRMLGVVVDAHMQFVFTLIDPKDHARMFSFDLEVNADGVYACMYYSVYWNWFHNLLLQ